MQLQKFLRNHNINEGLDILSKPPYSLIIKTDDCYSNLVLFKYSNNSIPDNPINIEARGVIFDKTNWNVVARGFDRFFNYNEPYAVKIDFRNSKVEEKIDGSIIKLYYYNNIWIVSSSSMIDANKALEGKNFYELFITAALKQNLDFSLLNKNNTYIFELVSPEAQIVIHYPITKIYHIGTRNNLTGLEVNEDIGIEQPHRYSFRNFDEVVNTAAKFDKDKEGFVVVDNKFRRVKVKSLEWLKAHALSANSTLTLRRAIELLLNIGDLNEYLTYFPDKKEVFNKLRADIAEINNKIDLIHNEIIIAKIQYSTKKEIAEWILSEHSDKKAIYFAVYKDDDLVKNIWNTKDAAKISLFYKKLGLIF